MSRLGMWMSSPCAMSRMPRPSTARFTASRIWSLWRRRKRSRLPMDLFLPASRLSIICWSMRAFRRRSSVGGSGTLAHAQVPLAEQAHLLRRVALGDHPRDEVLVLLRLVGARLRVEADHRQQLLG